jgi:hypothetical protein
LLCCAAGVALDPEDAEASLRDVLAAALEANREMAQLTAELREENGRLREENARLPGTPAAGMPFHRTSEYLQITGRLLPVVAFSACALRNARNINTRIVSSPSLRT